MEGKQKALLQALTDAERTLERMQKTKSADIEKIRAAYAKELSKIESQHKIALARAHSDTEKANERIVKLEKIVAEKTELIKMKTREISIIDTSLLQEKKRAEDAESALAELKNQMQFLQTQSLYRKTDDDPSIKSQLAELLTATRMAPIYEILSRLPKTQQSLYPMSSMLGEQIANSIPHVLQSQQPATPGEILSAINSLRAEQDNVNARISTLLNEQQQTQQQQDLPNFQYEIQYEQCQQPNQDWQDEGQKQNFNDFVTESVAPAEVSIDALAASLENAIEERNGAPMPYQSDVSQSGNQETANPQTDGGQSPGYESLDDIITNISNKNFEENEQF